MRKSKLIIYFIWIFILGSSCLQGLGFPSSTVIRIVFPMPAWLIILAPFAVIIINALLIQYVPGEKLIGQRIDVLCGKGSYRDFMKRLKIELLLSSMCFCFGVTGLLNAVQSHGDIRKPSIIYFFFSGGIAFLAAHFIVKSRKLYEPPAE